jgi:hypothetical protein
MVANRRALFLAPLAAVVFAIAGCGGGGDDSGSKSTPNEPGATVAFPEPKGRGLEALIKGLGEQGPVLAQSVDAVEPGKMVRFGFGLFDRTRKQIGQASAAVYIAPKAGGPASGPYVAEWESLTVDPSFRSKGVEDDPDSAAAVYVSELEIEKPGKYYVIALLRLDNRLVPTTAAELTVVRDSPVPEVGEKAPRIHTPTESNTSKLSDIETREPPDSMHKSDFANEIGKRPVALIFSTPALCQSRVCGPVVDILEQVKARHDGDDMAWIHMEIYKDNDLKKGFRDQLTAFKLQSEPWLFTFDKSGRVAARLEGAFGPAEAEQAVKAALR